MWPVLFSALLLTAQSMIFMSAMAMSSVMTSLRYFASPGMQRRTSALTLWLFMNGVIHHVLAATPESWWRSVMLSCNFLASVLLIWASGPAPRGGHPRKRMTRGIHSLLTLSSPRFRCWKTPSLYFFCGLLGGGGMFCPLLLT